MTQRLHDALIHRYLLGLATEAECEEVEDSYLREDGISEHLGAAEDELIDTYLDGQLDADEKRQFETYFLNAAERREKLVFERALRSAVLRIPAQQDSKGLTTSAWLSWLWPASELGWKRWGTVAVAVSILGCAVLLLQTRRLSRESLLAHKEKQALAEENRSLRRQLETSASGPSNQENALSPAIVSTALIPGLTRSGGSSAQISIPPEAQLVQIKLQLVLSHYRSYRAAVQTVDGKEILSLSHLRPNSQMQLVVLLPTPLLNSDDYQIILAGETANGNYEEAATFYLRVIR